MGIIKRFRSKISKILIAVFVLNILSGFAPLPVAASNITFPIVTGVELSDNLGNPFSGEIKKDSKLRITYNWAIPDEEDVFKGDTYTLIIPQEIKILKAETIPLKDKTGAITYANAVIHTDNTVLITFTEEAEVSDVKGSFYVYSEFDETKIGGEGETQINFDLGAGNTQNLTINFEKSTETPAEDVHIGLTKSGTYDIEKKEILWKITAKPESSPAATPISNMKISDTLPEGLTYVTAELKVVSGSAIVATGSSIVFYADTGTLECSVDRDVNTKAGETYFLEIVTKVDDTLFSSGEDFLIRNRAGVTYDGGSSTSNEASVPITVDYIHKSGNYVTATRRIDWTITINSNYLSVIDPLLLDKIPKGLTLDKDSVMLDGNSIGITGGGPLKYEESGDDNQLLSYLFAGSINTPHVLTYSTDVTDKDAYNSNKMKTYTNEAQLSGDGIPLTAKTGFGVGVPTSIIEKDGISFDRKNHQITWKIVVNNNKININDGVISDNIPAGLSFIESSFRVNGEVPADMDTAFNYSPANAGDTDKTGSFTYSLGDTSSDRTIITYDTKVVSNSVYAVNGSHTFYNKAVLEGANLPEKSSSTGTSKYVSQVIDKKALKYDYLTREATWSITVNQNKMLMKNVYISDVIGSYQDFVPGSVSIDGAAAKPGNTAAETDAYYYNEANKTFTYRFPAEFNSTHTITYKTKITDLTIFDTNGDKKIFNTAKLRGDDIPSSVSSQAEIGVSNVLISKTHNYSSGSNYIPWKVVINQNQLRIENPVLEDNLQEGLELDTESVKLYELVVDADGNYDQGDEIAVNGDNVKYNGSTRRFEFYFDQSIQKAYMLTFNTDIDSAFNNTTFSNTIHFKGSYGEETSTSNSFSVVFQTAGGGASGASGSVTVIKRDEYTKESLAGAVFELLDKNGNILKTSDTTGADGTALFSRLKFRTYYIREKTAPEGYRKSDQLYEFTLKNEEAGKDIFLRIDNEKIKGNIEFIKVKEDNTPLLGAEFALYKDSDTSFSVPLATAVSSTDGIVRFENVEYGDYRIKEITAPVGYQTTDVVLLVSITEDGVTVMANPESVSNIIIRGNIKVVKKDEDTGIPLPGAWFSLYDKNNNLKGEGKTDERGEALFAGIPYGAYIIRETQAPEGYQRSLEDYSLRVDSLGEEKIEIINSKHRSLVIEKTDAVNAAIKLSGAVFEVKDSAGTVVGTIKTDQTGRGELNGLSFGKYTVTEKKAPNQYTLDKTVTEIEISKANTPDYEYIWRVTNTKTPVIPGGGSTPPVGPGNSNGPGASGESGTPGKEEVSSEPEINEETENPVKPGTSERPSKPWNGAESGETSPPEKKSEKTIQNKTAKGKVDIPAGGIARIKKEPQHGKVSVDNDGNWSYTPQKDYTGKDEFVINITLSDGKNEDVYIKMNVEEITLGSQDSKTGKDGSSSIPENGGQNLPKTGESSRLPQYLTGILLLGLGLFLGKRQRIKK